MGKRISFHASERIKKRGASFGFVKKVVRGEVRHSWMPANRPDRIILTALDDLSGRYWSVVCNIECTKAITVYKASKKEIRNYEKSV